MIGDSAERININLHESLGLLSELDRGVDRLLEAYSAQTELTETGIVLELYPDPANRSVFFEVSKSLDEPASMDTILNTDWSRIVPNVVRVESDPHGEEGEEYFYVPQDGRLVEYFCETINGRHAAGDPAERRLLQNREARFVIEELFASKPLPQERPEQLEKPGGPVGFLYRLARLAISKI